MAWRHCSNASGPHFQQQRAPLPLGPSSGGSLGSQAGTPTSNTTPGRGAHIAEDSSILDPVKEDPEINIRSLATRIGCGHSAVLSRLQILDYKKVLARWIPHTLTDGTRFTRVSICYLSFFARKEFLENFITGNESWVLYDSNAHRAVWLPRGEDAS
ncbi:hypothetical protein RB195_011064 [Necator americanus]|uniref:Uncharacterized protein n=1 Tax=Necator americanus TaxID=51031 RepID=A0ABR1D0U2_NECAM